MQHLRPVALLAVVACSGDDTRDPSDSGSPPTPNGEAMELVTAVLWVPQAPDDDPFPAHRPDTESCEVGWEVEFEALEVNTDRCTYGAFDQPALSEVAPGDAVVIDLWYDDLWAPEPAEAHLAFGTGDAAWWELHLAVPGPADVLRVEFDAPAAAALGEPVWWHVHNHGSNSYRLQSVTVRPR